MSSFVSQLAALLPDVVHNAEGRLTLRPRSASEVVTVVRVANDTATPLEVPGGAEQTDRPLLQLNALSDVDKGDTASMVLRAEAGAPLAEIEQSAQAQGWTLGLPEAVHPMQLGAWLAAGASGRIDKANDPVPQNVAGLDLVTPTGELLQIRAAPRRAVGPDLIRASIGARGRLGVIVAAAVVARRATTEEPRQLSFGDAQGARDALRWMQGHGVRPLSATVRGNDLTLVLASSAVTASAVDEVVKRAVSQFGGSVSADSSAPSATEAVPSSTAVFDVLAAELDPKGILQPDSANT